MKYVNTVLFKINPMCDKNKPYVAKSFYLFFCNFKIEFFLVLEVLDERSCFTKEGAAHGLSSGIFQCDVLSEKVGMYNHQLTF